MRGALNEDSRQPALGWALLTIALAVLLVGSLLWWPRTVDDAFIIFRYADNLVAGNGPVFNPGERVEGYTSPGWVLLMAAAIAAGFDPVPASKLCGLLASLLLPVVLYLALRRAGIPAWGAGLGALLLASSSVLQIWSVAGLETNAYALLLFTGIVALVFGPASSRAVAVASGLLVAAALTRPEGLAYWVLGFGWVATTAPGAVRLHASAAYTGPGLVLAAHFAWRLLYYGQLLPNTYYTKTGGGLEMLSQGLHGLQGFVSHPAHVPWLLAAIAGAVLGLRRERNRRPALVLSVAVLLHLLYVVSVGDDGLRIHRFYVPVLAPMACLVGLLFASHVRPWLRGAVAVAVVLAAALSILSLNRQLLPALRRGMLAYQEGNIKLGRHLAATRDPDTVIAVAAAGAIPYYSRLPTIDMYGLNDAHIAHRPFPERRGGRLMKWDNAYVLSRQPDLIVINRGYFAAGDELAKMVPRQPAMLAVAPLDRDLFELAARDGSYGLRPIRFEDGSMFFVFERIP